MNTNDFIFTDKPNGISTHRSDPGQLGWCEYLSQKHNKKYFVAHRLDKTTSGTLVFGANPDAADQLRQLFEARQIKKRYLFLTDRNSQSDQFEVHGEITQSKKVFDFSPGPSKSSHTLFKRIKRNAYAELWEAVPLTGKTHQIRLHAQSIGLPILGDTLYGGSPFSQICLHSESLELPGLEPFKSAPPIFFERLGLLNDPILISLLSSLDSTQRVFQFLKSENNKMALRGATWTDKNTLWVLDILGPYLWVHAFSDSAASPDQLNRLLFISQLLGRPLALQLRPNRGKNLFSDIVWMGGPPPTQNSWTITENSVNYLLKSQQGASYGLFLDQKANRLRVQQASQNKTVLNLFCYTAGFSLNAAKAGAQLITNVDISKTYLEWGKENFLLNHFSLENTQWFKVDSIEFLKKLSLKPPQTKGSMVNRYDIIICDPPTFARTEKGVFRLEKDLEMLLNLCQKALAPRGELYFSCNLEAQDILELHKKIIKNLPFHTVLPLPSDLDYELSHSQHGQSKMFLIKPKTTDL